MASPEHSIFLPRESPTPLKQAGSLSTSQTGAESSTLSLLLDHVLEEPFSLNHVDDQTSTLQPEPTFGHSSETSFPRPIKGGAPASESGIDETSPTATPKERELTWGERLSKDGFWVFDYLQGIGPTEHLRELAVMEGIDFNAGLNELRALGLLDESNPAYPEVNLPKPKLTPR